MQWKLPHILNGAAHARSAAAGIVARARLTERRALDTLNSIGDAVICTDIAGNITYVNPVAERMTGWQRQEAYGRPLAQVLQLIDAESREPAPNPLATAMLHNKTLRLSSNCLLVRRDGHETPIEDSAAPVHDRLGQVTGAVIVFHEAGAAHAASQRMSYLAQHDFLTGLPNRMLLNDRLRQAIAATKRHGKSLAVLYLDVDGFKRINDALGHGVGDQLLQSIARRLVSGVRASDTVSRHGGDEFVVLLPDVAHEQDVAATAKKIVAAIGEPHRVGERELRVTVSVGISVCPSDGMDAETLLTHADIALIHAKATGRCNHRFFEPALISRAAGGGF
jgi:diguanylate cyclase (GGDEF)-like protein/PAS domain S-box-containing protein